MSTVPPSSWTNVNDIVAFQHHVFVVFHHNDAVSAVAQVFQRLNEFLIVALMQTNARFVKNV